LFRVHRALSRYGLRVDYDVIVLGLGPGGEAVGEAVAKAGQAVLGVEERLLGGECPYFGCIPSKMIVRGAELLAEGRRIDGMAGGAEIRPDYTPVATRIRDEATDDWDDRVAVDRFEKDGATFVRGTGRLIGRDDGGRIRVEVGGEVHAAPTVVVATGTAPALPPVPGLRELYRPGEGPVWTNREALQARHAPASLVVLGGGAIGCELAQGFARFGARTTVVEAAPHLLMPEEPEAGQVIADVFRREGIAVYEGVGAERVEAGGAGVVVTLAGGERLEAERLLVAAGRRPNLDVGLDSVGLDPAARNLEIDEHMQVRHDGAPVDGLYALGDITGRGAFTHVAVWQAGVLAAHLLDRSEPYGGYHGLAWATFTDPEVGRVGLTEAQARDRGLSVRVGTQQIASNSRGWIHGPGNDGFIKLVEDADRSVLVGATVVSPYGGELLGMLTLAVHAAVPVRTMATMHYAFPTLHRGVLEAIHALA
jgi:pyruvate/2-oxoglutarate dehydrogenase complex dihydrolipoamide dehydrogenase (E3) component